MRAQAAGSSWERDPGWRPYSFLAPDGAQQESETKGPFIPGRALGLRRKLDDVPAQKRVVHPAFPIAVPAGDRVPISVEYRNAPGYGFGCSGSESAGPIRRTSKFSPSPLTPLKSRRYKD